MVNTTHSKIVMFHLDPVNIIKMEVRTIFKKTWSANPWEVQKSFIGGVIFMI